jgi:hypothetical protein
MMTTPPTVPRGEDSTKDALPKGFTSIRCWPADAPPLSSRMHRTSRLSGEMTRVFGRADRGRSVRFVVASANTIAVLTCGGARFGKG